MASQADFLNSYNPAVELLRKHVDSRNSIRIVTHNDADGVAAGGILSKLIFRLGANFKTTCEKRVDKNTVERIASEKPSLVIFSDMGSGYLDIIHEGLPQSDVIVLDHHISIEKEADNIIHVNPILYGFDGAREISGAGVSYFYAKKVDEKNIDLSSLGVVGALADQQDKGEKKTLIGLNQIIESDAKESNLLDTHIDLIFYGHETRPIAKACAYTTTPFIPGLSGREDNCLAFLTEAGIELKSKGRWRALRDLTEEEKRVIYSALSKHMIYEGCDANAVHDLIGTVFTFKTEASWIPLRDGREYASLLNACARIGRSSVGISISMGDRDEALNEATNTLDEYRRKIGEYLDWVRKGDRINERKNIYSLEANSDIDERIIGVVASILLSTGILKHNKPIIASAITEDKLLKISARASENMSKEGLHLGNIMMKAAEPFKGRGGGHDIAAGAFIPIEAEKEFLELVNKIVGEKN